MKTGAAKLRWARGGAQRPALCAQKGGCAKSAGAHARPKPTSLSYIYLGYFVCVSVIHNCGTLCYSFSFNNQTDKGDEGEGLKREGLEGRDRKWTDRRGRV